MPDMDAGPVGSLKPDTPVGELLDLFLRVYREGDHIDMSYNPHRVNAVLDRRSGRIKSFHLG
ncbi:MAG: hypothetical protein AAFX39_14205 [Pseudomonadota bacterium]